MLSRAPHIVHLFLMANNPITAAIPNTRRSARIRDMADKVDESPGRYFLMDFCKFGTLHAQLVKAAADMPPNRTERWFPESILWRIFDCLIKACMAMECPPRYVPANAPPAQGPAAAPVVGGYLPEVVAPGNGANAGHYGIVHGDLVGKILVTLGSQSTILASSNFRESHSLTRPWTISLRPKLGESSMVSYSLAIL